MEKFFKVYYCSAMRVEKRTSSLLDLPNSCSDSSACKLSEFSFLYIASLDSIFRGYPRVIYYEK